MLFPLSVLGTNLPRFKVVLQSDVDEQVPGTREGRGDRLGHLDLARPVLAPERLDDACEGQRHIRAREATTWPQR